jgi:glyoxylase-like metal-dependent hydrolase (beta-lactamase superfamily II)
MARSMTSIQWCGADVVVAVSEIWKTTCTVVRAGEEALLIDSPILPGELEALPGELERARFTVTGLFATHADWDHLLGRYAFPEAPIGCGETTAARLAAEPGAAEGELRDFDEEYLIERPGPLSLEGVQGAPVPGGWALGERELELHPADGHTSDGTAVWIPWARILVCGDYLSPGAIPELSPSSSVDGYLATLARLEPLIEQAEAIVPGHGEPLDSERAAATLREDRTYVEALQRDGAAAPLPPSRRTGAQQRLHEYNVSLLANALSN